MSVQYMVVEMDEGDSEIQDAAEEEEDANTLIIGITLKTRSLHN